MIVIRVNMSTVCPRCGAKNDDDARFCTNCRAKLFSRSPPTGSPMKYSPLNVKMIIAAGVILVVVVFVGVYLFSSQSKGITSTTLQVTTALTSAYQAVASQSIRGSCTPVSGYLCENLSISKSNGLMNLVIGQNTGSTQYNVALACAVSSNNYGLPYAESDPWYYVMSSGYVKSATQANPSGSISLASGEQITVKGLPCYDASGRLITSGTASNYTLWYNYTSVNTSSPSTYALIVKMAEVTT